MEWGLAGRMEVYHNEKGRSMMGSRHDVESIYILASYLLSLNSLISQINLYG